MERNLSGQNFESKKYPTEKNYCLLLSSNCVFLKRKPRFLLFKMKKITNYEKQGPLLKMSNKNLSIDRTENQRE